MVVIEKYYLFFLLYCIKFRWIKSKRKKIFIIKTLFSSNLIYKNWNFTEKMGNYLG